jgi:hypothetical protein
MVDKLTGHSWYGRNRPAFNRWGALRQFAEFIADLASG